MPMRDLVLLMESIRLQRGLRGAPALQAIKNAALVIELRSPNAMVTLLAKEVQIAASDLLLGRRSEPAPAMWRRLEDRIERLDTTLRNVS
jgi:tRNA(Phe) wybutosine-synthesizing methylase Tyw3